MPQHMDALAMANASRLRRAEIRAKVNDGEPAHCVVDDPNLATVYVRELLGWQYQWGPRKIGACLSAMGAYNPRCSDLTEQQKAIMSYYCTWKGNGPSAIPPRPPNARGRHPADM